RSKWATASRTHEPRSVSGLIAITTLARRCDPFRPYYGRTVIFLEPKAKNPPGLPFSAPAMPRNVLAAALPSFPEMILILRGSARASPPVPNQTACQGTLAKARITGVGAMRGPVPLGDQEPSCEDLYSWSWRDRRNDRHSACSGRRAGDFHLPGSKPEGGTGKWDQADPGGWHRAACVPGHGHRPHCRG